MARSSCGIYRKLKSNFQCVSICLLLLSELGEVLAKPEDSETPHWSNDIPGFYHRLFFSGGETEVRAHHKGLTAVHNALPERGTSSLRLCNGKTLVNSFFLDQNLVSCRLETDPVEIAEFYRSLTDDFNCAEQKKAESSASEQNDLLRRHNESSKLTQNDIPSSRLGTALTDASDVDDGSSSAQDDDTEFSDDFDESDGVGKSRTLREPLWCSIEDPLGRQIWNETFALLVGGPEQKELMQEIRKLLRYRAQKQQCRFLQKSLRRHALRMEKRQILVEASKSEDEEDFVEVLSEEALRAKRRAKRSLFSNIMPGTKWCGSGNAAKSFNELGASAKTDDCCREHDQCPYTLVSFQKRWGLRNRSFFTLSHCRCDERFRSCLKMARTSQSRFVGRLFFDLLSKQCFVFKKVRGCARLSWDGSRCIRKKWAKRAIVRDDNWETAGSLSLSERQNSTGGPPPEELPVQDEGVEEFHLGRVDEFCRTPCCSEVCEGSQDVTKKNRKCI